MRCETDEGIHSVWPEGGLLLQEEDNYLNFTEYLLSGPIVC